MLAAILHDVGMLGVSGEVLAHPGVLDSELRRLVESHCHVRRPDRRQAVPDAPWVAEAVAAHHERLDGTGYPEGLKGNIIPPLARLLAICDVYAAFCVARPHRQARATRTALADTLLLAEQEQLDHHYAECLLSLSFYPVGSVVELAHNGVSAWWSPRRGFARPEQPGPSGGRPADRRAGRAAGPSAPHRPGPDRQPQHSPPPFRRQAHELLGRRFPQWAA